MILNIQPISQRDSRWATQRLGTVDGTTIGNEGCLITAICMLSTYYGHSITPDSLDDLLTERNLYYDGNLYVNNSITQIYPDIQFDKVIFCETTPAPISDIKNYLDQGKPVVVSLINQGERHFILVVGYDGDQVYANDPWMGDQVAINDRWGDPATKILQVDYFSGPVPNQIVDQQTPPANPTPTPPDMSDQTVVNLGSDLGFMEIGAIRSQILNSQSTIQQLQTQLNTANTQISQLQQTPQTVVNNTPVTPPSDELDLLKQSFMTELSNIQGQLSQLNGVSSVPQKTVNQIFIDSLKSRKLILSVISSIIPVLNAQFHLGLSFDQLMTVISPLLAFVGVEGAADIVGRAQSPSS